MRIYPHSANEFAPTAADELVSYAFLNLQIIMSEITEMNPMEQAKIKPYSEIAQYLSFTLGQEEYGVDVLRVQEIRSWEPVSRIPNVPAYEIGVVNLRGAIVPIIDLRERFQLGATLYTSFTVVVVLQARKAEKMRVMGVVVDTVSDVIDVDKALIQSVPNFGAKVSTEFINSLVSVNQRMVMLLDVDKLLKLDDVDSLKGIDYDNEA